MKTIMAILMVSSLMCGKSQNYFDHLKENYPVYGFTLISGYADGAADVLQFKYSKSIFPQNGSSKQFWDPKMSWRNKYLSGNPNLGPKFMGSKNFFVPLTDGWHLSKSIRNYTWTGAILSYKQPKKKWYKLVDFVLISITRTAGWHLANETLIRY
ncbi:MAG: hypothetical protein MK226_07575 [Saprospiraceae bacterium]|jgi:hypothetical protein|nr:hypothetical protein [Saprospiraceae bacterium]